MDVIYNSLHPIDIDPALEEIEEKESHETVQEVFKELAMDSSKIPADPLDGHWA